MRNIESTDVEYKESLKIFSIWFVVLFVCLTALYIHKNIEMEETTEAFRNSEVLVCYDTLIVSNSNWKLVDNHLINNNSAGYLSIDNCKIKGN